MLNLTLPVRLNLLVLLASVSLFPSFFPYLAVAVFEDAKLSAALVPAPSGLGHSVSIR